MVYYCVTVISVLLLLICCKAEVGNTNLYSMKVADINGKQVDLERYRGKISLVVNVASECGYTRLNYESLVALQKDYPHEIFNVLGFPCNQFGDQEPNNEQTILNHVKSAYSVNFPMFSKVSITGSSQSPVYSYLIGSSGSTPQWNFSKYLVNQDGDVVQYFSHTQSFDEIRTSLDYLISK